jgi:RNA polymerase sigma factor (sigma-70 family)
MNEARMWHRRARRSREGLITDLCIGETTVEIPLEFMDRRPSPEATYLQKERRQLLRSAMERLKPETREALKACDLEEQSTIAAAVALGITVSAVKSRKLRGRLALRRTLESRLPPDGRRSPKSAQ